MKRFEMPDNKQLENGKIDTENVSDMEVALFYAKHLDNPCGVEVNGKMKNIREFYIKEAQKALEFFNNPEAKIFLEMKIKENKILLEKERK
jgi:hypothetical protein